jgi:hypothetical protein
MFGIRRIVAALALIAAACWSPNANAAPILLDDFSTAGFTANPVASGTLQTQGVLGSPRTVIVGAPGLQNGGDFIGVLTGPKQFSSQSAANSAFTTTLSYTFAPLTLSTASNLGLGFVSIDGGSTDPTHLSALLQVNTTSGTLSETLSFPSGNSLQNFLIPFAALTGSGDLSHTTGITLTFNTAVGGPSPGADFILSGDTGIHIFDNPVPEPASLATFGLIGLVSVVVVRRKLKVGATAAA